MGTISVTPCLGTKQNLSESNRKSWLVRKGTTDEFTLLLGHIYPNLTQAVHLSAAMIPTLGNSCVTTTKQKIPFSNRTVVPNRCMLPVYLSHRNRNADRWEKLRYTAPSPHIHPPHVTFWTMRDTHTHTRTYLSHFTFWTMRDTHTHTHSHLTSSSLRNVRSILSVFS